MCDSVLDRNTWNHITVYELFVLDRNTWYHKTARKKHLKSYKNDHEYKRTLFVIP